MTEPLYHKFDVYKQGRKVKDCFVLRPEKDRHAIAAIHAYADSVLEDNPVLSHDLKMWAVVAESRIVKQTLGETL